MVPAQCDATILVVEDPFIRGFVKTLLSRHRYRVIGADPSIGIAALRSGDPPIDIVITNRPELFAEAAETPLLYIAASPEPARAAPFRRCRMLSKPFRPEQMLEALAELREEASAGD